MSTGTPMKDLKDCASEGTKQVPPDSSSDAIAMRTRLAQVPKSLPIPKIYPPLEYPPVDIDVENTPPPSPPTCIDTPPLSPNLGNKAAKEDQDDEAINQEAISPSVKKRQPILLRRRSHVTLQQPEEEPTSPN